jgi:thymidylate synthase
MTNTTNQIWISTLALAVSNGTLLSPRGNLIRELSHHTVAIDMNYPVVTARKTNVRFMAAEAEWILRGRDDLDSLMDYNPRMADYSDDGVTLTGAYGPRIVPQLPYVVDKILGDPDTRQATLTVWTPSPAPSRDIPCTVAMDFKLRGGLLNAHVFMRSSDIWLGLPYDIFSFTMVACKVISKLNQRLLPDVTPVRPGLLYVTAASSHLYDRDLKMAEDILEHWKTSDERLLRANPLPKDYYLGDNPEEHLEKLKDSRKNSILRWWEGDRG